MIHTYKEGTTGHEEWTKIKHVLKPCIVAHLEGSWRTQIRWRGVGPTSPSSSSHKHHLPHLSHPYSHKSSQSHSTDPSDPSTLLDLTHLHVIPKRVRPLHLQSPTESRKLWENVTGKLVGREFGEATKFKQGIEQRQRDKAGERKRRGEE